MRVFHLTILVASALCLGVLGAAADTAGVLRAEPGALQGVMKTLRGTNLTDAPRTFQNDEGYFVFLGSSPGTSFDAGSVTKSGTAEEIAREFIKTHGGAFGLTSRQADLTGARVKQTEERTYVRMQQTYGAVPVFGGFVNVQLDDQGGVVCVMSKIACDTRALDNGDVAITPTIWAAAARQAAIAAVRAEHPALSSATFRASDPELNVYEPSVLGNTGATRLTWKMTVRTDSGAAVLEQVLVDARTGAVALQFNLLQNVLYREVWDGAFSNGFETTMKIVRAEGEPPTNRIDNHRTNGVPVPDADDTYDYLGDTYNFYLDYFGRDSYDNQGARLYAITDYPYEPGNAFWTGSGILEWNYSPGIILGSGMASDDVVAHELTHGVTQFESNLIYMNQSGAINESLSDIFGEFVDQTNRRGTDTSAAKWLMGEDTILGAIRSMKDPPRFEDPDRMETGRYYIGSNQNAYVHFNSGVGNKLCYLLTDGGIFTYPGFVPGLPVELARTWRIDALGLRRVANLFYEAQTNLLVPASNYRELGYALFQAALTLARKDDPEHPGVPWFDYLKVDNVRLACLAVQLLTGDQLDRKPLRHFRATAIPGERDVVLTWETSFAYNYRGMRIVRQVGRFPATPSDGLVIVDAFNDVTAGSMYLDRNLPLGAEYFYGAFAEIDLGDVNGNGIHPDPDDLALQVVYARATVGQALADPLTESFKNGNIDLAFSQVLYTPFWDPTEAFNSGQPQAFTNYSNYRATITKGVYQLPVGKQDSIRVPMTDDDIIPVLPSAPVPYFGNYASSFLISSNGFVAAQGVYSVDTLNRSDFANIFPTLEYHYDFPRLDFLFADLAPNSGGEVWVKFMDDRTVVTFERVPEIGSWKPNTVQVELFYSGHIRVTYLELNVTNAVCGLSDGNGIPRDPKDLETGVPFPKVLTTDLSNVPPASLFTLKPIPNFFVSEGDTVEFFAEVDAPGTPVSIWLSEVPEPIAREATFERITDTKYKFTWVTTERDGGSYWIKVSAGLGGDIIAQFVSIVVADPLNLPVATDVNLAWPSADPEGPHDSDALLADYTYFQEDNLPEGTTEIHWFRNDAEIPWLFNQRVVPPYATQQGEKWYFTVLPKAILPTGSSVPQYLVGPVAISRMVVIGSDATPDIDKDGRVTAMDIQMVINSTLGASTPNAATDVNHSGATDSVDIQIVINKALAF